jgi:hypothetical protein
VRHPMICLAPRTRRSAGSSALALSLVAAIWSGCAEEASPEGGGGAAPTGAGGAGANGNGGDNFGGANNQGGSPTCISTSAKAEPTPLDIIFMLDWSASMQGDSWAGTTSALQSFFTDPLSTGINAGLVFSPTIKPLSSEGPCDRNLFKVLDVPIAPLPENAFPLVNVMPSQALGTPTPLWAALGGALQAATAYQDAHPTHKVVLVMTGDGDYNTCKPGPESGLYNINAIAGWAKDAFDYNGVRTYVIRVESSTIICDDSSAECGYRLQQIAEAGGTDIVYNAENINEFSVQMAEIRKAVLGCDFAIPEPPDGEFFVPDEVNFTYTPGGKGMPVTLPRADNLADCGDEPGWYFDNNVNPSKIIACPASCTTIQNDPFAEVAAEFGCASIAN